MQLRTLAMKRVFLAAVVGVAASTASGQTYTWNVDISDGQWTNPNDWIASGSASRGVPTTNSNVLYTGTFEPAIA